MWLEHLLFGAVQIVKLSLVLFVFYKYINLKNKFIDIIERRNIEVKKKKIVCNKKNIIRDYNFKRERFKRLSYKGRMEDA